jgi:mono/diheme cytochrome c family protein
MTLSDLSLSRCTAADISRLAVLIFVGVFASCSATSVPEGNSILRAGPETTTSATAAPSPPAPDGAAIYQINCARCHGPGGEGAKKGIPLISGHALHHTEGDYIKQVTDGEGKKMPAFRDTLSSEEISAVVKYVRSGIQAGIERGAEHH